MPLTRAECTNPTLNSLFSHEQAYEPGHMVRRQELVPGYVTTDAWDSDGLSDISLQAIYAWMLTME